MTSTSSLSDYHHGQARNFENLIEMARGKRGSNVAARRSSPRLDVNVGVTLPSSIPQSSRCPRTRYGGNDGAGWQNIEPPNVVNEAPNGNARGRSGPRTRGGMTIRTARTARGIIEAQLGVEGLTSFIKMQSGFMERQMEILEKQSETTEKLSEALDIQKKTKLIGSDFKKFKMSPPSFQ
ncbi:uncharacterized protein LOC109848292 [Asparagus officinalis]|uniref:uncharacterized protein LOC109848292 n=1 Tax=Asparagus officinalis TaxID=4686 RepID=UPI00098E62D1|nr:uncharacterized protein LOC109848292 [Asparagus officinalis]